MTVFTPLVFRIPRGSGGVPDPSRTARSSFKAIASEISRSIVSDADGDRSSNSSRLMICRTTTVFAVSVTRSHTWSEPLTAAFSDFQFAVFPVASLARFVLSELIGIVVAPAWIATLIALARSMMFADRISGTRKPPAASVPSAITRFSRSFRARWSPVTLAPIIRPSDNGCAYPCMSGSPANPPSACLRTQSLTRSSRPRTGVTGRGPAPAPTPHRVTRVRYRVRMAEQLQAERLAFPFPGFLLLEDQPVELLDPSSHLFRACAVTARQLPVRVDVQPERACSTFSEARSTCIVVSVSIVIV